MSKVILRWVDEKEFIGTDSNRHSIVIGRTSDEKHPWVGMKPSDLLLLAVASCAMFDVIEILMKQREPFIDIWVECAGKQNDEPPYSFTKIHNHYVVKGAVDSQKLDRAIKLSEDKYCSVISSLRPQVEITSDYEIIE